MAAGHVIIAKAATGRPQVALTFDDGPGGGTLPLLDLLAAHRAQATFFLVGSQVELDPATAERVAAAGHQIGSHTAQHLDHQHVDPAEAVADMLAGAATIERVLRAPAVLYRAPYGHFIPETLAQAAGRGWTCVGWTVLGGDWQQGESGRSIADRVLAGLGPGAIVVLHDGRREQPADHRPMLAAVEILLAQLARRHLEPVTVSDLLDQAPGDGSPGPI